MRTPSGLVSSVRRSGGRANKGGGGLIDLQVINICILVQRLCERTTRSVSSPAVCPHATRKEIGIEESELATRVPQIVCALRLN